jgi:hypothetical protein
MYDLRIFILKRLEIWYDSNGDKFVTSLGSGISY